MMSARSRSEARATTSAALGPSLPMRMSSGPSRPEREAARGLIELHRGHAEIEHDAVDGIIAEVLCATRSSAEKRSSITVSRPPDASTRPAPLRDRTLVAVDADDLRAGGCEDRAGIATGAEGAVDIDAAAAGH